LRYGDLGGSVLALLLALIVVCLGLGLEVLALEGVGVRELLLLLLLLGLSKVLEELGNGLLLLLLVLALLLELVLVVVVEVLGLLLLLLGVVELGLLLLLLGLEEGLLGLVVVVLGLLGRGGLGLGGLWQMVSFNLKSVLPSTVLDGDEFSVGVRVMVLALDLTVRPNRFGASVISSIVVGPLVRSLGGDGESQAGKDDEHSEACHFRCTGAEQL